MTLINPKDFTALMLGQIAEQSGLSVESLSGVNAWKFAEDNTLYKFVEVCGDQWIYAVAFEDEENDGNHYVCHFYVNVNEVGMFSGDFGGTPVQDGLSFVGVMKYFRRG